MNCKTIFIRIFFGIKLRKIGFLSVAGASKEVKIFGGKETFLCEFWKVLKACDVAEQVVELL